MKNKNTLTKLFSLASGAVLLASCASQTPTATVPQPAPSTGGAKGGYASAKGGYASAKGGYAGAKSGYSSANTSTMSGKGGYAPAAKAGSAPGYYPFYVVTSPYHLGLKNKNKLR